MLNSAKLDSEVELWVEFFIYALTNVRVRWIRENRSFVDSINVRVLWTQNYSTNLSNALQRGLELSS
jgi:hypothetical protein